MSIRPLTAATTGALLGMSALFLTAAPAATASERPARQTPEPGVDSAAPSPQSETRKPHKSPLAVAHRGASGYAPENTLAAVDKAHELGIDWVENDVQRTKDGELVVLHDTTLSRTTDVEQRFPGRNPWKVSDFTLKEIKTLNAGSWFGNEFAGERIPTLREFLDRVTSNGQNLLLELKSPELYPGIERETLGQLGREGWLDHRHTRNRLIVQSFNKNAVAEIHKRNAAVKTGFLGTPKTGELKDFARFTDQINPTYADATKDYVRAVQALKGPHHKRMEVFTWTVNDAATARKVADAGVDGIISNKPDIVSDAVAGAATAG
ncbi:glycerophosphodiester phosphodiesterase [Streptomyces albus subsp. chlorinus]|uniref:glycerophosphodiester phosphodiesterase n=1 Tax=Streptomyces albus TaxID=1888 RepID=UPI003D0AF836